MRPRPKSLCQSFHILKPIVLPSGTLDGGSQVRFRSFWAIAAAASLLAVPIHGDGQSIPGVAVLIDFGDGTYVWADLPLSSGPTAFNATQSAAAANGLPLNVSFAFGPPFVVDIGNRRPQFPDYWHFFLWKSPQWVLADVGPASVNVTAGDGYAWYLARDPFPAPGPLPLPTPEHRHPSVAFRGSLASLGLASAPGPATARVAWSVNTTSFEISGTPAGAGGLLVVPTWTGLRAYDLATGGLRWANPGVRGSSSPALFNDSAFVGGKDGRLHAVSLATGKEQWNVTIQVAPRFTGISSSPKVYRDLVVVGAFNESGGAGAVVAVDVYTRAIRWSFPTGSVHFSSPAILNDTVYVGVAGLFDDRNLTFRAPYGVAAINAKTGGLRFFHATNGSVRSSPAVSSGLVFYSTIAGYLDAIDASTGTLRWTRSIGPSVASPAVDPRSWRFMGRDAHGLVVAGSGTIGSEGRLWAFDMDGNPIWSFTLNGPVQASPTIAGNVVYAGTNAAAGTVYAIRAKEGAASGILWSFTPTPNEYLLSSPVVIDGRLIVASDNGFVYALQDAEPTAGPDLTPLFLVIGLVFAAAIVPIAAAAWMLRRRLRGAP